MLILVSDDRSKEAGIYQLFLTWRPRIILRNGDLRRRLEQTAKVEISLRSCSILGVMLLGPEPLAKKVEDVMGEKW